MSEEKNEDLQAAYEELRKAKARLNAATGGKAVKLRYRIKADPVKYLMIGTMSVLAGVAIGRNRALSKELEDEKNEHYMSLEDLHETQGQLGEITRRAEEAGVDTSTVKLQVVRDNGQEEQRRSA